MKAIYIILLFFSLIIFSRCEYNKDEVYFVEIDRPEEKEITFNLAEIPSGSKIYIYQETKLLYSLGLPNGNVLKEKYNLDEIEIYPNDNYIILDDKDYDVKTTKKLIVEVEIDSDSESIAGKLGLENYVGVFEYEIIFVPDAILGLQNVIHHKNKDDYFELTWNKPNIEGYTVDKYRITYYHARHEYTIEITDPSINSLIDTRAVHGYLHYTIETFFKESYRESWIDNYTVTLDGYPDYSVKFEYTGPNSGRISWPKNEYKAKYAFAIGYYGNIIYEGYNNFFDIQDLTNIQGLGTFPIDHSGAWVELYILPIEENDINRDMPIHYDELHSPSLITRDRSYDDYRICTDTEHNLVFIKSKNELWTFNSKNFDLTHNAIVNNLRQSSTMPIYCSPLSSKVFIPNNEWIDLISYDLKTHEKIQFESDQNLDYQYSFLGTNNVVFIHPKIEVRPEEEGIEGVLYAYDLDTKKLLTSLSYNNKWNNISISRDGKYICINDQMKMHIYEFSDNNFSRCFEHDLPNLGSNVYDPKNINFNEKESNKIIITLSPGMYNNEMYVIDIKTGGISEKKRFSYQTSDPYTGNIITSHTTLAVFDATFTEEKFISEGYSTDYFINNRLLKSGWGVQTNLYYLDLTNYLKK